MKIVAAKKLLKANDQLAVENRAKLDAAQVLGINVVGSPGAGKTTFLEALFGQIRNRLRMAVIEGDIAGSIDAERMDALGVPVVQINTEGACHLDATMIGAVLPNFDLAQIDMLLVENVGNLVCTAGFDLGEHLRIALLSVTEGDDKVVKYPAIFQGSHAVLVTKMDLVSLTNFRIERVIEDVRRLSPSAPIFPISALHSDGISAFANWLVAQQATGGKMPPLR